MRCGLYSGAWHLSDDNLIQASAKSYRAKVGLAWDRAWNAIFGGSDRETISSSVGRKAVAGVWWALIAEQVINAIFFVIRGQRNHCRESIGI